MNNNDEYIKMILALPEEFFDGWEWQAGDHAILLDDNYKREVLVINTHSQIVSSRIAKLLFPRSLEGCKTEEHITRLRPIPNQEQLQELLINFHMTHNGFSRKRAILHIMGHWADYLMRKHDFEYDKIEHNQDYEYFGNPEDFDILMLRFTVGIILMLGWNGDSWEKTT